jgi:hypothetical protein
MAWRVFVFALGLLALSWPFGVGPPAPGLAFFFGYFLVCWALLLVILALMARSIRRSEESQPHPPEN